MVVPEPRCTSGTIGSRGRARLDAEVLGETDFGAGEAPDTPETIASDLFRVPRAVDALVADCREERRLQCEREHVVNPALAGERLDCGNDGAAHTAAVYLARNGDCCSSFLLCRQRFSQPSLVDFTPGVADSM